MLRLRPPRADEGPALTALCLRSKASHGYDQTFMEACRKELTVDPSRPDIAVAEIDGLRVGMAEISVAGDEAELEKIFVEPACYEKGAGRMLFDWARTEAAKRGARVLTFDADPGAVAFYEKMGALIIGRSPSGSIPGRMLPRLRLRLNEAADA
ncbi:GNAT family N-acetyltransferase [Chelativorans sp. AA-79]|uniref:GNAT family N-acetyltransferase n=1 Tax=Chelativorans sp. AA-79 TaxID=3028735 RepID=UPI0023F6CE22|nr:GNAT family N-acetyltransferase [Chelativorans sp. AA-79]WEX09251.1 GNAT family N-acetyltransferase [Chelativorans sp. AA-79]